MRHIMKHKIYTILAVAMLALTPFFANAKKGETSVGLMTGYNTKTSSGLAGIYLQYQCNSWLRLAPDIQTLFRKNDLSSFHINGNAHYLIPIESTMNLYPLAGITYQSWRYNLSEGSTDRNNYNHFGLNVGCGFDIKVTPSLKLMVEGKYSLVKDASSGSINIGIGYIF